MVRRIKPVPRIIKIENEIKRIRRASLVKPVRYPSWDETWIPRVDVYEKAKEIIVEAEIPGVAASDISITVQSNRVEFKGQKKEVVSSGKIRYLLLEREYGGFRRLVALPATVVPDRAKATLENGVVILHLKKYLPGEEEEAKRKLLKTEE